MKQKYSTCSLKNKQSDIQPRSSDSNLELGGGKFHMLLQLLLELFQSGLAINVNI